MKGSTKKAIQDWQEKNATHKRPHSYFWDGFESGSEDSLYSMGFWRDMPVHQAGALHAMKMALEGIFAFYYSKEGADQTVSQRRHVSSSSASSCADSPFARDPRSCTATSTASSRARTSWLNAP